MRLNHKFRAIAILFTVMLLGSFSAFAKLEAPENISPANDANNVLVDPTFVWKPKCFGQNFEIQICKKSDFKELIRDLTIKDSSIAEQAQFSYHYKYYIDANSTVFWRVRSYNDKDTSDWSAITSFKTEMFYPPANDSPVDNYKNNQVPVTFRWFPYCLGKNSELQVALDSSFANPIFKKSYKDTSTKVFTISVNVAEVPDNSTLYWRVRIFDSLNTSRWSKFTKFTTRVMPKLAQPTNLSPKTGVSGIEIPSKLIWSKSDSATSYRLILGSKMFKTIYKDTVVSDTSVILNDLNKMSYYMWMIQAQRGLDTSYRSIPTSFITGNISGIEIQEPALNLFTSLFPNPVSPNSIFNLNAEIPDGAYTAKLYDYMGGVVENANVIFASGKAGYALGAVSPGAYILALNYDGATIRFKVAVR